MSLSATTSTNPYLTASASSSGNAAETFEQKWARIQAAKKTNPFAEDIAKKFEINKQQKQQQQQQTKGYPNNKLLSYTYLTLISLIPTKP